MHSRQISSRCETAYIFNGRKCVRTRLPPNTDMVWVITGIHAIVRNSALNVQPRNPPLFVRNSRSISQPTRLFFVEMHTSWRSRFLFLCVINSTPVCACGNSFCNADVASCCVLEWRNKKIPFFKNLQKRRNRFSIFFMLRAVQLFIRSIVTSIYFPNYFGSFRALSCGSNGTFFSIFNARDRFAARPDWPYDEGVLRSTGFLRGWVFNYDGHGEVRPL